MIEKELILFVLCLTLVLGFILGVTLGFQLYAKSNTVGDMVIAPGDEDAPHYMFLDLDMEPELLERRRHIVLNIKMVKARK